MNGSHNKKQGSSLSSRKEAGLKEAAHGWLYYQQYVAFVVVSLPRVPDPPVSHTMSLLCSFFSPPFLCCICRKSCCRFVFVGIKRAFYLKTNKEMLLLLNPVLETYHLFKCLENHRLKLEDSLRLCMPRKCWGGKKPLPVASWHCTNWHVGGTKLIWCETANGFMIG